jgi:hypothetical protein
MGISNFYKILQIFTIFLPENFDFYPCKGFFNEKGAYIPQTPTPKKGSI